MGSPIARLSLTSQIPQELSKNSGCLNPFNLLSDIPYYCSLSGLESPFSVFQCLFMFFPWLLCSVALIPEKEQGDVEREDQEGGI